MHGDLLIARRLVALQFFARLPPKHVLFQWPSSHLLLDIQDYFVNDLCLNLDKRDGIDYKRSFLKHVINLLQAAIDNESENNDEIVICGNLLECYAEIMAFPTSQNTSTSQKISYYYPDDSSSIVSGHDTRLFEGWNCITVQEEIFTISRGNTGLKTWVSSLRMAAHLIAQPDTLAGENMVILELGSGSGFLGAILGKQAVKAASIHLTDRDGIVLDHLHRTINQNFENSHNITIAPLDWLEVQEDGSDSTSQYLSSLQASLVLASDTVYDPLNVDPFCQVLKIALSRTNRTENQPVPYALVANPIRNNETHQLFLQAIDRHGLAAQVDSLHSASIDLILSKSSSAGQIQFFPSVHDETKDGPVILFKITNETRS